MAIPFVDDLIEWLYQRLGKMGWVLTSVGLLLLAVMAGVWLRTGELPNWSASGLGIPLPHTPILAIDDLLAYAWSGKFGIPVALIAIGLGSSLFFGRRARQMANAETELYMNHAPRENRYSLRTRTLTRSS